jgi:transketolase
MPCWELFEEQPQEYRDEVLPPDVRARLSVEPGVRLGWERWIGEQGDALALDRFGASAPGTTVLEKLGFNVDNVVARATALLERVS